MATFGSNTNMPTYVNVSGTWQELTGPDQPYSKVSGTWQGAKNMYAKVSGTWQQVYQYDNTAPNIPQPTVTNAATEQTVSWTAITDDASGVASATLYQRFVGTSSGDVAGTSYSLPSFASGNTTMAVPLNRRKQGAGESWSAYYYISASDVAGNSTSGANSVSVATSPYDVVGPTVPKPTVTSGGSSDTISWTAVTDDNTGVASATLYQAVYNVTTNTYTNQYASVSIGTGGASNTTMSIPNAIRNTPTGDHYQVYYWISATDNAGNTVNGDQNGQYSAFVNTKPLGTFTFFPSGTPVADSRNIGDTAWLGTTVEGIVGKSSTRAYGCWFYGTNTIYNKCKQWQANSGTIFVKRAATADLNKGNSGTWTLQGHNLGGATAAATFIGTGVSTGAMNTDSFPATVALDAQILSGFADGTIQGMGAKIHTSSVAFLLGNRDFSGLITLVYNQKENI